MPGDADHRGKLRALLDERFGEGAASWFRRGPEPAPAPETPYDTLDEAVARTNGVRRAPEPDKPAEGSTELRARWAS